jgi:hypothetical protein
MPAPTRPAGSSCTDLPGPKTCALKAPFDPHARLVDQETGLEYEDFAAKLLGEPAKSTRNSNLESYRRSGYPKHVVKAYWQGFDGPVDTDKIESRFLSWQARTQYGPVDRILGPSPEFGARHEAGIAAGKATGCWGPATYRDDQAAKKAFCDELDKTTFRVLAGYGTPRFGKSSDFGVITIDTL